jgi:hypothetical protein
MFPGQCGMRILHALSDDPKKNVKRVQTAVRNMPSFGVYNGQFAVVMFTDSGRRKNGKKLAAFIKRNNLGKVTSTKYVFNPNSCNMIKTWQWYIDRTGVESYVSPQP